MQDKVNVFTQEYAFKQLMNKEFQYILALTSSLPSILYFLILILYLLFELLNIIIHIYLRNCECIQYLNYLPKHPDHVQNPNYDRIRVL